MFLFIASEAATAHLVSIKSSYGRPPHYRWQLMDMPVTLDLFNSFPAITPYFWQFGLRLRKPKTIPVVFTQQAELQLASSNYVRYKYKLYPCDQVRLYKIQVETLPF